MKLSPADQATVNTIIESLNRRDEVGAIAVTTAIVKLYERQTSDEKNRGNTIEHNGRGFKAYAGHDTNGSYYARYALGATRQNPKGVISPDKWDEEVALFRAGKPSKIRLINGSYLDKARKIVLTYAATQLLAMAKAKRAARDQEQAEREAALIAAQSADCNYQDSYCPSPRESCPDTVRSPRSPMVFDRPINVTMV